MRQSRKNKTWYKKQICTRTPKSTSLTREILCTDRSSSWIWLFLDSVKRGRFIDLILCGRCWPDERWTIEDNPTYMIYNKIIHVYIETLNRTTTQKEKPLISIFFSPKPTQVSFVHYLSSLSLVQTFHIFCLLLENQESIWGREGGGIIHNKTYI